MTEKKIDIFPKRISGEKTTRMHMLLHFAEAQDPKLKDIIPQLVIPDTDQSKYLDNFSQYGYEKFSETNFYDLKHGKDYMIPVERVNFPTLQNLVKEKQLTQEKLKEIYSRVLKIAHHIIRKHKIYPYDMTGDNIKYDQENDKFFLVDLGHWSRFSNSEIEDKIETIDAHIAKHLKALLNMFE